MHLRHEGSSKRSFTELVELIVDKSEEDATFANTRIPGNTPFDELLRSCQNKETTTDNDSSFSRYDESEELISRSRREAGIYASTSFPAFNRLPEVPIMTPSSNEIENYYE